LISKNPEVIPQSLSSGFFKPFLENDKKLKRVFHFTMPIKRNQLKNQ